MFLIGMSMTIPCCQMVEFVAYSDTPPFVAHLCSPI